MSQFEFIFSIASRLYRLIRNRLLLLQPIGEDGLLLHISDNACGLPVDFDLTEVNSLSMKMMKALSIQLGGELKLRNNSGLHISPEFVI